MKFLCTVSWVNDRLFYAGVVYDLPEEDVRKYASLKCRDGATPSPIGAMSRFEAQDDAGRSFLEKITKKDKLQEEEDPELEQLRAKAKELGIRGFGIMKKDKLIEAVKKASA